MTSPNNDSEFRYKNGIAYECTLNPDDKHQYLGDPIREVRVTAHMRELLRTSLHDIADYYFKPELSDVQHGQKHSSGPRLHYHGVIIFKDVLQFMLTRFHNLIQSCSIQVNYYRPDHWPEYMQKQSFLTKGRIKSLSNNSVVSKMVSKDFIAHSSQHKLSQEEEVQRLQPPPDKAEADVSHGNQTI